MSLKAIMEKIEDLPEAVQELYSERDGKFELTGIEGVKTGADVERVQSSLEKERRDHKETKEKFRPFMDLNAEEAFEKLDKFEELKAAAEGKIDEEKLEELAEARARTRIAPLEREVGKLKTVNEELQGTNNELTKNENTRTLHDQLREAGTKSKVIDGAMADILLNGDQVFELTEERKAVTKDNVGCTPGIPPDMWLQEMQEKRPFWWPPSQGGGAGGGGQNGGITNNPWSRAHWNITNQAGYYRQYGAEKAGQAAKMAGSTIGATQPPAEKA